MATVQMIKTTAVPETEAEVKEQLDVILDSHQRQKSQLIPLLQRVQLHYGYLPEPAMKLVSTYLGIPASEVYGVATFYAQFRFEPTGRHLCRVCRGTACHVRGGARVLREVERQLGIKPGETTDDMEFTLETVACIGACALAPTLTMSGNTHGKVKPGKVAEILDTARRESQDDD